MEIMNDEMNPRIAVIILIASTDIATIQHGELVTHIMAAY